MSFTYITEILPTQPDNYTIAIGSKYYFDSNTPKTREKYEVLL